MLTQKKIVSLFKLLNKKLKIRRQKGEVGLVGGAVMCLVFNAREATQDVDAIFEPSQVIRQLAVEIAQEESIPEDWLNDGAKAYIQPHFQREKVLNLSNLIVWAPEARYMLAMKCLSARWDTHDKEDVIFLIQHVGFRHPEDVFKLIEHYYPRLKVPAKTQFFIEEVFSSDLHE